MNSLLQIDRLLPKNLIVLIVVPTEPYALANWAQWLLRTACGSDPTERSEKFKCHTHIYYLLIIDVTHTHTHSPLLGRTPEKMKKKKKVFRETKPILSAVSFVRAVFGLCSMLCMDVAVASAPDVCLCTCAAGSPSSPRWYKCCPERKGACNKYLLAV